MASFIHEGGVLSMYYASGKKKHDRYFYMEGECLSWDKKKRKPGKANKSFPLKGVQDAPAIKSAKEWFDMIDADGSGAIDEQEFANLYKRARGEKLKKKELKAAMVEMDTDGSGEIELDEFESWWAQNGGDLEVKRHLALTVYAGDVELLLVAPDTATKARWLDGLTAQLRELGTLPPEPVSAAAPAPGPSVAPAPAPAAVASVKEVEAAKVNAIGDKIRDLKQAKAGKDAVMAEVEKLQAAKAAYEKAVGEPFPAPQSDKQPKQKKQTQPKQKQQQQPKKAAKAKQPQGGSGSSPSAPPASAAVGMYMPWAVAIKPQPAGSGKLWSLKITANGGTPAGAYAPLPPTANATAQKKPAARGITARPASDGRWTLSITRQGDRFGVSVAPPAAGGVAAHEVSDGRWALSITRQGDRFGVSLNSPASDSASHTVATVDEIVAAKEQRRIAKLVEDTEKHEDGRIARLVAEQERAEQELQARRLQRLARLPRGSTGQELSAELSAERAAAADLKRRISELETAGA